MPLEIVLQLFRRMGPRVILVSHEGTLVGLVTIKDVLRHEASEKHRVATAENAASRSRQGSWDAGWGGPPGGPDRAPALEGLLEDGFTWARTHGVGVVNTALQRVRQYNGTPPRSDEAYRFEMNDEPQQQQQQR